ncbi:hypothetical protein ACOMHN_020078 [Nucella lapillus]
MLNAVLAASPVEPTAKSVVFKLRDYSKPMVDAWQETFSQHTQLVEISYGDIFKGAPSADAIVSPANSFGFMDGGIDMAYSLHFDWQLMERLQEAIRTQKDGELLVGDALIIPIYKDKEMEEDVLAKAEENPQWSAYNEGKLIKYLISAPTMRTPQDVCDTVNAYLAFRAVILAVKRHNADSSNQTIRSVLCPGLGTAVGRMPKRVCAKQMLLAYETFQLGAHSERRNPKELHDVELDELDMKTVAEAVGNLSMGKGT